ncbi:Carbonyl reductase [Pleurostoma richardsiae]|uniref:Carbonyl reductase n=1 Tax=Pleurostoma richardsiae TaxID=41990 RepID=A0AA38RJL0_9PEZI|nr:Carbonyl reductase [Pleurostoma richardsiae]
MAVPVQKSTVVLVTGANQGIGFEISKKLGLEHKDYHVIVSGRRKDAVEEAADKLAKLGCSVEPLVLDVTSDESIAQAVKTVEGRHGRLDVLVNNAGISGAREKSTRELFNRILDTNVSSVAMVTDAFIPLLGRSTTGAKHIVFITSGLGSLTMKKDPSHIWHKLPSAYYSTSKAALNMLALHYAVQWEVDPSWKINLYTPPHCATNLNYFSGPEPVENGAIGACRLATLGPDGETGTFTDNDGPVPW